MYIYMRTRMYMCVYIYSIYTHARVYAYICGLSQNEAQYGSNNANFVKQSDLRASPLSHLIAFDIRISLFIL